MILFLIFTAIFLATALTFFIFALKNLRAISPLIEAYLPKIYEEILKIRLNSESNLPFKKLNEKINDKKN